MNHMATRHNLLLAGTVLVLLAPLALLGAYVGQKHQWAEQRLAELEPRHSRLLGLQAQKAEVDAALLQANALRSHYVYPSDQDAAQTGNAAQQRVRDIFSSAGLQILSSQVLPAKPEKGFDRIPLLVRVEGDMLAMQSALAVLNSQSPIIVMDDLDIQLQGNLFNADGKTAPRLGAGFSFSVLREPSP